MYNFKNKNVMYDQVKYQKRIDVIYPNKIVNKYIKV